MTATIQVDQSIGRAFMRASRDRNPLHIDDSYATRTQFGRTVVYGICGLIAALAKWSAGRSFSLKSLRVKFEKSLVYGDLYPVEWVEQGSSVKLRILNNGTILVRASFDYENGFESSVPPEIFSEKAFEPLADAAAPKLDENELSSWASRRLLFSTDPTTVADLLRVIGLSAHQLPQSQLTCLLWASYFVGMQMPGRQALFSELNIGFNGLATGSAQIAVEIGRVGFDERFNRVLSSGVISATARFQIAAYVRPAPVNADMEEIRELILDAHRFDEAAFLISGSARGFGEALAKTVALQGACVAINFRSSLGDGRRVLSELLASGCHAIACGGDVAVHDVASSVFEKACAEFGKVDYCICNASPQIEAKKFSELGSEGVLKFTRKSMAPTLSVLAEFLKRAPVGGMAVLISSIYTLEGRSEFAHYVAAKAAQEKLFESLAREYRDQRFLVARLPKILTDQTNVPFDREPPSRAIDVARSLADAIAAFPENSNFHQVNFPV